MLAGYAVVLSFLLLLVGSISLASAGLVADWAVPLAIAGSGATILVVLYVAEGRRPGSAE
jgi:hypothetical protein